MASVAGTLAWPLYVMKGVLTDGVDGEGCVGVVAADEQATQKSKKLLASTGSQLR